MMQVARLKRPWLGSCARRMLAGGHPRHAIRAALRVNEASLESLLAPGIWGALAGQIKREMGAER